MCQWTKDRCDTVSKLSPFLLTDKKETIQSIYEKIGQKSRYDELVKKDAFFNVKKVSNSRNKKSKSIKKASKKLSLASLKKKKRSRVRIIR